MLRQEVVQKLMHHSGIILWIAVTNIGRPIKRYFPATFYTTRKALGLYNDASEGTYKVALAKNLGKSSSRSAFTGAGDDKDHIENGKMNLASSLACLVQESDYVLEQKSKPKTRLEVKKFLEMRIKKKVKEQYTNGKFHDLLAKVIADPNTLKDAYDCIKVTSNVDLVVDSGNLSFESVAKDLAHGKFDVEANTYSISTKGAKIKKEELVFSKLYLRVVQEAIRVVLEVVYRPDFSKISHGFRSGRCHLSALKYISKGIPCPDWWFTLHIRKKVDDSILTKLISSMEEKIEDPRLFSIIRSMFDARVLNMEFGDFPKGHGLPQEGVLSPILMNIYLDLLDREIFRMSMRYEAFDSTHSEELASTKLRHWFRRQMKGDHVQQKIVVENSGVRVHCCRFMDEIFFAVSGPKEVATAFKSDIEKYLKNSLYLEVDNQNDFLASSDPHGVKFLGTLIRRDLKETSAVRIVHKLKEKVRLFSEQKRECWDMGTIRIGRKWLAHGLKKIKESEIKQLADTTSILNQISSHRKSGMKTDHWYKVLLKIWMQDANAGNAENEEIILAKHIVEPALPQELRDSYHQFQKRAKEYISLETASTLALLSGSSSSPDRVFILKTLAPTNFIKKRLFRYGLTNREGYARTCHLLIVLDHDQIIDWFSGIVRRWLRWYRECDNYNEVKLMISNQVRLSCIRTLAAKYRIHETEIEKKFDLSLSRIPSTQEIELEETNNELASQESTLDGAVTYGINYSGLCLVSLARMVSPSRPCNCFVIGCSAVVTHIYRLHIMERQKFPGWKTGFSSSIHPALHRRKLGLCKQHLKDLFLGDISLQAIDFGAWR
ncbi:nuclear intron maturase 4, mitochondrial [Primulina huaijiensis]|uniref:nuclear intron maturase 4, mitochondrial n=1 Tax=Primulina huaijiensis TaxID=1492673 RepID=UPI003CC75700